MKRLTVGILLGAAATLLLLGGMIVYGVRLGLDTFGMAPAFRLTDQFGQPVSSEAFRGKVVVADFIYTKCPDICPLLSIRMQALQERLREGHLLGRHVQLLSFTVEPARDTLEVLRTYAEQHRADRSAWRFLTGPVDAIQRIVQQGFLLGIQQTAPVSSAEDEHADGDHAGQAFEVMHSTRFVLIDQQGQIRAYYDARELDLERVVCDIRQVLP